MHANYNADYTAAQEGRSRLRKFIRRAYLNRARALVAGPTLDFGCGVGELLARLPSGSAGVEYNPSSVALCRSRGLSVDWYDGHADNWRLSPFGTGFRSLVLSHVLEHFDEPMDILGKLLDAAAASGFERVLVIVPGKAGFRRDSTHRTFVDVNMLRLAVTRHRDWKESSSKYFPLNIPAIGDWFVYHELQYLMVREGAPSEAPTI